MPRARHRRCARAGLGCALALAAGCLKGYDPCLVPASVVAANQLRLLAIRADPPEALVDLDADGEAVVQVRALVVSSGGSQLRGRLCVPTDDLRCPDDGTPPLVGPPASSEADATLEVRVPIGLIRAARAADPLQGYGGIRVQLDLEALGDHALVSGRKTLLFSPRATTPRPNRPIELQQIDFSAAGALLDTATPLHAVTLEVAHIYGLRPRLAPLPDGSSPLEEFELQDLSGRTVRLREQVSYSFFTTPQNLFGDLEGAGQVPVGVFLSGVDTGDEPPEGTPDPPNGLVRLNPLKAGIGRVWVVARESRGAVAWMAVDEGAQDNRHCNPCPTLFFGCD